MQQSVTISRPGSATSAVSGAYKVDITRGERIGRISLEWFSRPDDERYLSFDALHDPVRACADRATARTVEIRVLRVEASCNDASRRLWMFDTTAIHAEAAVDCALALLRQAA